MSDLRQFWIDDDPEGHPECAVVAPDGWFGVVDTRGDREAIIALVPTMDLALQVVSMLEGKKA